MLTIYLSKNPTASAWVVVVVVGVVVVVVGVVVVVVIVVVVALARQQLRPAANRPPRVSNLRPSGTPSWRLEVSAR